MHILVLKWRIVVLCLIFDTLQELHKLLGLNAVENRKLGTYLRMFPLDTSENRPVQAFFSLCPHTQPLSRLQISEYETVFHTQLRIPLDFQVTFSQNLYRECTDRYCSDLPPHSIDFETLLFNQEKLPTY